MESPLTLGTVLPALTSKALRIPEFDNDPGTSLNYHTRHELRNTHQSPNKKKQGSRVGVH